MPVTFELSQNSSAARELIGIPSPDSIRRSAWSCMGARPISCASAMKRGLLACMTCQMSCQASAAGSSVRSMVEADNNRIFR